MKPLSFVLLLVASALLMSGCSDNATPVVPTSDQALSTAANAPALAKAAWVQRVSGGGHVHLRGAGLMTMSITAQKDVDGNCRGEFQGYDRDMALKIHLKVSHMDVEGNQVFVVMYGMLPETPWYGSPRLGYGMVLITDNGQGNKAEFPDQHSWVALWPEDGPPPWPFVTSSLAHATVSEAITFLTTPNPNGFGWGDAMLYVPVEMGNFQVQSR